MKLTTEDTENTERELSTIHRWIERNHPDGFIDSLSFSQNLERVADRWYERLERVERERDRARALAEEFHRDQVRLLMERDEAREKLADALQEVDLRTLDFDRMRAERDEAREKIERQAERISNLFEKDQTRLLMERDEARDQVEELTAVIKGLRAIMRQEAAK
jgi:uncharacterized coiled-coil DUF342 family protein